jgi:hypothetical protein
MNADERRWGMGDSLFCWARLMFHVEHPLLGSLIFMAERHYVPRGT